MTIMKRQLYILLWVLKFVISLIFFPKSNMLLLSVFTMICSNCAVMVTSNCWHCQLCTMNFTSMYILVYSVTIFLYFIFSIKWLYNYFIKKISLQMSINGMLFSVFKYNYFVLDNAEYWYYYELVYTESQKSHRSASILVC